MTFEVIYSELLRVLNSHSSSEARAFAEFFPHGTELECRHLPPTTLPVCAWLSKMPQPDADFAKLYNAILDASEAASWRQPYTREDFDQSFLSSMAWFPIADTAGPLVLQSGLIEVMLIAPNTEYPMRAHTPEEIYLVLSGSVEWNSPGAVGSPSRKESGEIMYHESNQPHAIRTTKEPALIITIWRGAFEMPEKILES